MSTHLVQTADFEAVSSTIMPETIIEIAQQEDEVQELPKGFRILQ